MLINPYPWVKPPLVCPTSVVPGQQFRIVLLSQGITISLLQSRVDFGNSCTLSSVACRTLKLIPPQPTGQLGMKRMVVTLQNVLDESIFELKFIRRDKKTGILGGQMARLENMH